MNCSRLKIPCHIPRQGGAKTFYCFCLGAIPNEALPKIVIWIQQAHIVVWSWVLGAWVLASTLGRDVILVVYFNQRLGAVHPKCWSEYAFLTFFNEGLKLKGTPGFTPITQKMTQSSSDSQLVIGKKWCFYKDWWQQSIFIIFTMQMYMQACVRWLKYTTNNKCSLFTM